MCLGWMDYCLFSVLSHLPPSTPPSRFFSSPVLCNCGLGESAGRTLNWKLVMFPPSWVFSSCCWSLALFFSWEGSLDIKLIIKPVRLCPASPPCLPAFILADPGNSSIPMVQLYILRLDEIGSPSYFTLLLPPHFSTCSEEHSVLITSLFFAFFIW